MNHEEKIEKNEITNGKKSDAVVNWNLLLQERRVICGSVKLGWRFAHGRLC